MNNLKRRNYKNDGANKYHIDCLKLERRTESIEVSIENVIQNVDDISILRAVLSDAEITKTNRNIVIKIGKVNKTIETEYKTGKILENAKLIGYINFMCIFDCYENIKKNKLKKICSGEETDDQQKSVLIMPFIQDGSIKNFNWSDDNFDILKSVLQQIVMSSLTAYEKCGFIHNDLHLDNVLLKKTKKDVILYDKEELNMNIRTCGYKIVIMDFDRSFINSDIESGINFYWLNLYNVLSRINTDLYRPNGDKIIMDNITKITSFIENQRINKKSHKNAIKLLDIINDSTFSIIQKPKLVYNPNIN